MVDLFALAELDAGFELVGSEGHVDGGDLFVVGEHAALLDEAAGLRLGRGQPAGQHQVKNGDLAVGELAGGQLGGGHIGIVRAAAEQGQRRRLGFFGLRFAVDLWFCPFCWL